MSNTNKEELLLKIQKQELLHKIKAEKALPIASFRLKSKQDSCIEAIALPYVLLKNADDRMQTIRNRSRIISELVEDKLVEVNFDLEVDSENYEIVYQSKCYLDFCEMVAEGATKPNFVFNMTKVLEGVITPYTGCLHNDEHEECGCGHHHEEHKHEE
ncbi:MAG: hypothetical protein WAX04_10485, partial [Oscillospiraceae bacterium]